MRFRRGGHGGHFHRLLALHLISGEGGGRRSV